MAALALAGTAISGASTAACADCGSVYQATLAEPNEKTQEVSTEYVRRILVDGTAILLDTRTPAEYAAGHIPGARNIEGSPSGTVAAVERLANGDKTKALVLYCNGPFCQASRRLGAQLVSAGFTSVRRYQLGIPVWRALGGPTEIEIDGFLRIYGRDQTAVFFDARSAEDYARGSLPGAYNVPADELASGALKNAPLPQDDFNRRVVLFGENAGQARALAEALSKRPWHNVSYFSGSFETLAKSIK